MTEWQKQKIIDVMHTLSVIGDGRATDPKLSAKACWQVLADVLDANEPRKGDEEMAKRGIAVHCTVCHRRKKPHGRAEPLGSCYCDDECSGYELDPKPGCLWPNETDEEFGYNACDNATELVKG